MRGALPTLLNTPPVCVHGRLCLHSIVNRIVCVTEYLEENLNRLITGRSLQRQKSASYPQMLPHLSFQQSLCDLVPALKRLDIYISLIRYFSLPLKVV
jgi:hypothetical protein